MQACVMEIQASAVANKVFRSRTVKLCRGKNRLHKINNRPDCFLVGCLILQQDENECIFTRPLWLV